MRPMSMGQTISWAIVLALAWVGFQAWQNEERDLVKLASAGAFFFVVAFFSMRVSSRLTSWTQDRFAKPEPPPPPIAATTARPEHAQRRREKRRKRSYRRKR